MSDALSEIARDQQRATAFEAYLLAICYWVENGMTVEGRESVRQAAEDTDLIRGGYWGSGTTIAKRIDDRLTKLEALDPVEWGKLVRSSADSWHHNLQQRLLAASPFAGKAVAFADYGMGFVRYEGALDRLIAKAIKAKGLTTFQGEKYALVFDETMLDAIEVVQLHPGYGDKK